MIMHIVLFKLNEPTGDKIQALKSLLESMPKKIPLIQGLEAGADIVRSERSFDLALVTKFNSLDDLREYQAHPYHAYDVLEFIRQVCEQTIVVDYQI